jgi:translocation and assembly module TamA
LPLNALQTTVFAARLKVGSIIGSATERIPADRRFYAGGGGSIRGFGYQLVSPLDANGAPTGGRSLIETSIEARLRVTRTIGVVPFIDAGSVSSSSLPGQGVSMRVAGGVGLRYYTGVGPLRADFAVPINKRAGVDKGFQFYLSFGQAF